MRTSPVPRVPHVRRKPGRARARLRLALLSLLLAATPLPGCISLDISHETQTSGTFESTGWGFTFLGWDIPKSALDVARENASDARLTNVEVTSVRVTPRLGWFDWVLDIIGFRTARIRGTWGFDGQG